MPSIITLRRVLPEFYEYEQELYFDLYRMYVCMYIMCEDITHTLSAERSTIGRADF